MSQHQTHHQEEKEWESSCSFCSASCSCSVLALLSSSAPSKYLICSLMLCSGCVPVSDQADCHWFVAGAEKGIDCFIKYEEAMKTGSLNKGKSINNASSACLQLFYKSLNRPNTMHCHHYIRLPPVQGMLLQFPCLCWCNWCSSLKANWKLCCCH